MDCPDCLEAVARLHLYLDRELSVEEVEIVQRHLVACRHCNCRFHVDLSIKRLIHERCSIARAPEHLRQAVLELARSSATNVRVAIDPAVEMELMADITETDY